jgi:hypothetical protein
MAVLVAELPETDYERLLTVLQDVDNQLITIQEATEHFQEIVWRHLPHPPHPVEDEVVIRLKGSLQSQVPR